MFFWTYNSWVKLHCTLLIYSHSSIVIQTLQYHKKPPSLGKHFPFFKTGYKKEVGLSNKRDNVSSNCEVSSSELISNPIWLPNWISWLTSTTVACVSPKLVTDIARVLKALLHIQLRNVYKFRPATYQKSLFVNISPDPDESFFHCWRSIFMRHDYLRLSALVYVVKCNACRWEDSPIQAFDKKRFGSSRCSAVWLSIEPNAIEDYIFLSDLLNLHVCEIDQIGWFYMAKSYAVTYDYFCNMARHGVK